MKTIKSLIIIYLLFSSMICDAETLSSLLKYNAKSIELNEAFLTSLPHIPSYDIPQSINNVSIDGTYLIIDYIMPGHANSYTFNVRIDLTSCVVHKGVFSGSYTSSNTCPYQVRFESPSYSIISTVTWKEYNNSQQRRGEISSFAILCKSTSLMNKIHEACTNLINPYLPSYETSQDGINQCYNKIQSTLKEYIIESDDVHSTNLGYDKKTSNVKIYYKDGNITIKWLDSGKNSGGYGFKKFITGNKEICFNLSNTEFGHAYKGVISFVSPNGIKHTDATGTTIQEYVNFHAGPIVCRELIANFIILKRLINETDFSGTLGLQPSTPAKPKPTQSPKVFNKIDL